MNNLFSKQVKERSESKFKTTTRNVSTGSLLIIYYQYFQYLKSTYVQFK